MFGLLKNKIAGFVSKLTAKKEQTEPKAEEIKQEHGKQTENADEKLKTNEIEADIVSEEIQATQKIENADSVTNTEKILKEDTRTKQTAWQKEEKIDASKMADESKEKSRQIKKTQNKEFDAQESENLQKLNEEKVSIENVHIKLENDKIEKDNSARLQKTDDEIERKKQDSTKKQVIIEAEIKPEEIEIVQSEEQLVDKEHQENKEQLKKIENSKQQKKDKPEEIKTKSIFEKAFGFISKKEKTPAFENVEQSKKKKQIQEVELEVKVSDVDDGHIERLEKRATATKKQTDAKIGVAKSVASIFGAKIELEKKDVAELLDEFELSLIESDVGLEVSAHIKTMLEQRLVGMKVEKTKMKEQINETIKQVLVEVMTTQQEPREFLDLINEAKKPVKILFVGPNGAGKTTTIAKIAKMLLNENKTVCVGACDTFRAAAIEQLSEHAQRLGIDIIKSKYGADPASVAFDAIKHAKAKNIDIVLIDSAGRQDTNTNLIDEMKKIVRISQPDMKIYIGESIGGSALVEQVSSFHEAINIDGAILTKLDCDAKGGTAISLTYCTRVPILFLGVGQKYEDLKKFDAYAIANAILS